MSPVSTRFLTLLLIAIMAWLPYSDASAETKEAKDTPIHFSADRLDVDRELGIVTARGHVEVNHLDRTLLADTISYNQKADTLTASGHVTLLEPTGDVMFAEYMEVSGDLKDGIVRDIGLIMSDSSRIAARGGRQTNGDLTLRNAVYSPCHLCANNPNRPPLWQVKAIKIHHDSSRHVVEYTDAWLEVAGIPVLYTPFLSHPDPTIKRVSGLLTPSLGSSTSLGFVTKAPYFAVIDDNTDATITPVLYSKSGPALEATYRQRFIDGRLDLGGSIVNDDGKGPSGHLTADTQFDINPTWRWGGETTLVSDDTYLRRYNFPIPSDTLYTTAYAEGFRGQNYTRIEAFHFRGLESGDTDGSSPLVLPVTSYQYVGKPGPYGGQYLLDASMASITRSEGADSTRVSLHPGWRNRYIAPMGDVYALSFHVNGDVYYASDYTPSGKTSEFNGVTGRLFPQAKLDWSFPLVRQSENVHQVIEPIVSLVLAPNGSNPSDIPNNDSIEAAFDESSLFADSRFAGVDRVDSGSRVDYGLNWSVTGKNGGKTSILVGQSIKARKDSKFADGSGLEDRVSDIVGKLSVSPGKYLNLQYRAQADPKGPNLRRSELHLAAGIPAFMLTTDYRQIDSLGSSEYAGREDINLALSSQIDQNWRFNASTLQDLASSSTQQMGLSLTYEDECLIFTTNMSRSFFHDRDLAPVDAIMLRVSFKTLGDLHTQVY